MSFSPAFFNYPFPSTRFCNVRGGQRRSQPGHKTRTSILLKTKHIKAWFLSRILVTVNPSEGRRAVSLVTMLRCLHASSYSRPFPPFQFSSQFYYTTGPLIGGCVNPVPRPRCLLPLFCGRRRRRREARGEERSGGGGERAREGKRRERRTAAT